jgi:hypothetical protein
MGIRTSIGMLLPGCVHLTVGRYPTLGSGRATRSLARANAAATISASRLLGA